MVMHVVVKLLLYNLYMASLIFIVMYSVLIVIINNNNRFIHSFRNQIHAYKDNIKERKRTNPNESLTSNIKKITLTLSSIQLN